MQKISSEVRQNRLMLVKKQMKLLWILLSERWGSPEQVAMSDIVELAQLDIPVSLICIEGSPVHAAAARHAHIKVYPFAEQIRRFLDFHFIKEVRKIMDESQINLIHIHDEDLLRQLVPIIIRHKEVSIVANRYVSKEQKIRDYLQFPLVQRLDYMLVLNEGIRQNVLSSLPLSEKKVKVINLGLDFQRFNPEKANGLAIRASWGADKDTIVIGSLGRLLPEVGQDTFIKAAAGLVKYKEWKMRFVIVGEDPLGSAEEYIEELKSLTQQFHMQDLITFSSLGENLPELMASFDIFVMAGREEVTGLGALESLAMERPVVLSRVTGSEEIVGNNEYGILVRPEDAFDLQQKILTLLENPSLRLTMGTNGRQYVLKNFDKQIRLTKTIETYEKCLRRRFSRFK